MTILFEKDWRDSTGRPRAVVHKTTKNLSFVKMAVLLSKMGIKNNLFHLSLYDPKLLDVDPHALTPENDPTGELRLRVAIETKRNVWYYLREVVRIPASGGDPIRFQLHRGNLAMTWCFLNSIDFNGTQCRQSGKAAHAETEIKTPTGWRKIKDLEIGDVITAMDGTPTHVTGVYPQGEIELVRLTFEDGRHIDCCREHLWNIQCDGIWATVSTEVIIAGLELGNAMAIPLYRGGVDYTRPAELHTFDDSADAKSYVAEVRSLGGLAALTQKDDRWEVFAYPSKNGTLRITSAEAIGKHEAVCIEVDREDQLYVAEDYIVTHNTIGAITLTSWVMYISGYNMSMTMLTHSDKLVQENVKRLKEIRGTLPPYLISKSGDDIDNKQGLDYKALKNSYLTYIGQKDKQAANRVGRGGTSPSIHFDELAFIPNIGITFPAIMAATNRARQNAAAAGMIHSNLYTTTAGDPSTEEGKFAFEKIIQQAFPFTEKLYDTPDRDAAIRMIELNAPSKLVNGTFSYLQLGYTEEWFRDTIRRNAVPPDEVQRDYLNNWICLAKHPIIDKAILEEMSNTQKPDPDYTEIIGDYVISWYVPEETVKSASFKKKLLILGMDSSENIGRDYTTFVCIDPSNLHTIFTFRCNDSNTTKIGMLTARILSEYPRMLFVPERKSSGVFITDMVIMSMVRSGENPFTRIYNRIVQDRQYDEFKDINIHDPNLCDSTSRKYLGFMTTSTSRDILYKQVLQRAASLARSCIFDKTLIAELSSLQATNGRIDHRVGGNDDMVIAWTMAAFVVFEGKNLHYYGIRKEELIRIPDYGFSGTSDRAHIDAQIALRKQVKELDDKIRATGALSVKNYLIQQKSRLELLIDPNIMMEPISVDVVNQEFSSYEVYTKTKPRIDRFNTDPNQLFAASQGILPSAPNQGAVWQVRR